MSKWMPINSAPHDGTVILIAYRDGTVRMGSRKKASLIPRDGMGPFDGYDFQTVGGELPIAWKPVPSPPTKCEWP